MSALSPERLAEIRGALGAPNIELRGDPYEAILRTAGMADDLLAEVDRLREGIEALHRPSEHQRWYGFPRADKREHYCLADDLSWPCPTAALLDRREP